jgi:hypothetical protein
MDGLERVVCCAPQETRCAPLPSSCDSEREHHVMEQASNTGLQRLPHQTARREGALLKISLPWGSLTLRALRAAALGLRVPSAGNETEQSARAVERARMRPLYSG